MSPKFFWKIIINALTKSDKYLSEVNLWVIKNALKAKERVDKNKIILETFSDEKPNLKKTSEN